MSNNLHIVNLASYNRPKITEDKLRLQIKAEMGLLTKTDYTTTVGSFDQMSRIRAGILKD